jgi:hypothetical protein
MVKMSQHREARNNWQQGEKSDFRMEKEKTKWETLTVTETREERGIEAGKMSIFEPYFGNIPHKIYWLNKHKC